MRKRPASSSQTTGRLLEPPGFNGRVRRAQIITSFSTPLREAVFQERVVEYARLLHWRVAHFRPARTESGWRTPMQGDPGFPDLVLARGERIVFAELKAARGELRPGQVDWLAVLGQGPAEVYVWRPSDWSRVVEILR